MGFKLLLSKIYLYIVVIQLIDHALVCWGWSSSMSSEWGTLPILVDPCHFPHVYPFFHLPDGSSKMLKNCEASHDRCFLSWNHVAICHCRWFEHHSTWNMRYHQDHRLVLATDGNFTWRWAPPQQSLVPRHSTMIVGPTGGGKSVVLNCLAEVQPFIPTGKSHESCWNIISPQFVFSDKLDSFWKTLFFGFGFFYTSPKNESTGEILPRFFCIPSYFSDSIILLPLFWWLFHDLRPGAEDGIGPANHSATLEPKGHHHRGAGQRVKIGDLWSLNIN